MSYCTPCPPCDTNFPLLCEPLETTANGKRLVVEDSAACQKTIQTPTSKQVVNSNNGNVEFATLNSVLQSGPVDLGSQPLTTTGTATVGSIISSGNIAINSSGDITTLGSVTSKNLKTTGNSNDNNITFINSSNTVGMQGMRIAFDNDRMTFQRASDSGVFEANYVSINQDDGKVGIGTTNPQSLLQIVGGAVNQNIITLLNTANPVGEQGMRVSFEDNPARLTIQRASDSGAFEANLVAIMQDTGRVGINTISPAKTLHVNGTVRLQGLPTYANNAAAVAGGLVADDVYKTSTGELRIVI